MCFTHKIVAVIGCAALAGAVHGGVKNGHFENRGAGNIYWKTCSTWTPSEVVIPNSGGNPCSYLHIKTPSCGEGRNAFQTDICVQPGGLGGFATLKFQAIANYNTGITVQFALGGGGTTTRKIPLTTAWTTQAVSLPMSGATTAKVAYSVCGAATGAALQVDNVSVCWTSSDLTTLGLPSPTLCDCAAACPGTVVEVVTGPASICDGVDSCPCLTPTNAPGDAAGDAAKPSPLADRIIQTLSAWDSCDGCAQDVWPLHDPDGRVDANDLIEVITSSQAN